MIKTRAESLFLALDLSEPELSVVLTDNAHIQELNAQWRGVDAPTDVLSFPLDDPPFPPEALLGDVIISLDYAESTLLSQVHRERIAASMQTSSDALEWALEDEVEFLMIHGLLHLVGHDHAEPDEEAEMKSEELRLWRCSRG